MTADQANRSLRVLVVAWSALSRELVGTVLGQAGLTVVATAAGAAEAVERCRACLPDVVLVDASVGDGVAVARGLLAGCPDARVVAFDVPADDARTLALAQAGARGFVLAEDSVGGLFAAVEAVAAGGVSCPPEIATLLLGQLVAGGVSAPLRQVLTRRELEVIALICRGRSNKEIARELRIELPTVKNHVHHILRKLELPTRADAAVWARSGDGLQHGSLT